jgi:hypothetical protein
MTISQKLLRHFQLLELTPKQAHSITNMIIKWKENSGSEFVIGRLKSIKIALINFLNNTFDPKVHLEWISHTRSNIKGPLKVLFKRNMKRHDIRRALSIVNVYYLFFLSDKNKLNAELEAIENIAKPYGGSYDYPEGFSPFRGKIKVTLKPSLAGFNTAKPVPSHMDVRVDENAWFQSLVASSNCLMPYSELIDLSTIKTTTNLKDSFYYKTVGGNLTFLHEHGGKCRVVAMPHAETQVVFSALHNALERIVRSIPEDCTFDQEAGARWAQDQLSKDKTLYSIDLKSATDRIPRWLQLKFLEGVIETNWLKAFDKVASLCYKTKHGDVYYEVGQPMGLYASFPLLALGQHGLVRMAGYLCGIPTKDKYRVLGDDIVISDPILANAYMGLLKKYDIPLSTHKCITGKIAEFAGYVITNNSYNKGIKFKGKFHFDNYTRYVYVNGKIPKTFIPPNIRKLLVPVMLAPREHGGLNLNPLGIPLRIRSEYIDPYYKEETRLSKQLRNIGLIVERFKSLPYKVSSMLDQILPGNVHDELGSLINQFWNQVPSGLRSEVLHSAVPVPLDFLDLYINQINVWIKNRAQALKLDFLERPEFNFPFVEGEFFTGLYLRLPGNSRYKLGWVTKKFGYYFLCQEELSQL